MENEKSNEGYSIYLLSVYMKKVGLETKEPR